MLDAKVAELLNAGSRRGDCVRHSSEIHCLNRKARRKQTCWTKQLRGY